jgi:SAM-dependent methyltransferase
MEPLERRSIRRLRRLLVPEARGRVLELGAGTGANLPYYRREAVKELVLTDLDQGPALRLLRARARLHGLADRLVLRAADAESLSFPDDSFDTVVASLLFCSVPRPEVGLREVLRVLRPGGLFLSIEHVRPGPGFTEELFDRITPAWKAVSKGCHLNRRTREAFAAAGFIAEEVGTAGGGIFVALRASAAGRDFPGAHIAGTKTSKLSSER